MPVQSVQNTAQVVGSFARADLIRRIVTPVLDVKCVLHPANIQHAKPHITMLGRTVARVCSVTSIPVRTHSIPVHTFAGLKLPNLNYLMFWQLSNAKTNTAQVVGLYCELYTVVDCEMPTCGCCRDSTHEKGFMDRLRCEKRPCLCGKKA